MFQKQFTKIQFHSPFTLATWMFRNIIILICSHVR